MPEPLKEDHRQHRTCRNLGGAHKEKTDRSITVRIRGADVDVKGLIDPDADLQHAALDMVKWAIAI